MDEVKEFVLIEIKRHYYVCALPANSIYVMYIMLYESLISMCYVHNVVWILNFHITFVQKKKKKAKKPMDEKILWTQRCNVSKLSKEQGILVQENDEVKTLFSMDKTTKWCFVHAQPMDEEMHK